MHRCPRSFARRSRIWRAPRVPRSSRRRWPHTPCCSRATAARRNSSSARPSTRAANRSLRASSGRSSTRSCSGPTCRDPPASGRSCRRVQLTTLDAVEHQALPFERLVEALAPERDLSRHPIFQALLALNPPEHGLALSGLSVEDIDPPWGSSRVDLFLILDDLPTGMEAIWEYSTDLFDAETVDRMASHFTTLLRAIVDDPDRPVDELELLSGPERELLTGEWNRTAMEFPRERLETLIAAQAARTPDAIAVAFEGRSVTYAELDARSNQLAHRLREVGVGGGDLVGICLPRSEQMLVALLATLKAGAAYVPIDPTYPAERQRFMLEDADVAVLITESGVIDDVPSGPYVLRLEAEVAELERLPRTCRPPPRATPTTSHT